MPATIPEDHGLEIIRRAAELIQTDPTCYRLRTTATGTFSRTGLSVSGKVTIVSINTSTWTALPATALTDRNAISIQNQSDETIKVNYDTGVSGFVGMEIPAGGERFYNITDDVVIYAKSSSTTVSIAVEEVA